MSKKSIIDALRAQYLTALKAAMTAAGEEVLVTGSNEFAIPCVDGEGDDQYIVVTVKVPSGSRDGDPYDGHAVAADYDLKVKEKAEKAAAAAEKKAAKIAKDKAEREAKAKAKAEREAAQGN